MNENIQQMVSNPSPHSSLSTSTRTQNNNNNETQHDNNSNNQSKESQPPALTAYIEKCLHRFKQLPNHIATEINKAKVQKELRGKVKTAKSHQTLWTMDWNNEPFPPHCMYYIHSVFCILLSMYL